MDDMGQLVLYRYFEHRILPKSLYNTHSDIYLLVFGPNPEELCDPSVEPVGIFHQAGIRSYIWRDTFWAETDWHRPYIATRSQELARVAQTEEAYDNYHRIWELTLSAARYGAPSPLDGRPPLQDKITTIMQSMFKIPINEFLVDKNKKKKYCRAIYRINGGA